MLRNCVYLVAVVGCSRSSQPTNDQSQNGPKALRAPAGAASPATTTCYRETSHPEHALRITLDPAHRTIALAQLASGAQHAPTEMFSVHGEKLDAITKVTTHDGVSADGKLDGPAWQWTSWTIKRTDVHSGDTSTTTFAMTSGGLTAQRSGQDQQGTPVEFQVIDCDKLGAAADTSSHFRPTEVQNAGPSKGG
ncbi:MAG TPA: hypothetical protein VMJ10_27880 [Kofleriaceae bacterium]|nr:hypothetical protein [Kofleriaceae bacterium]